MRCAQTARRKPDPLLAPVESALLALPAKPLPGVPLDHLPAGQGMIAFVPTQGDPQQRVGAVGAAPRTHVSRNRAISCRVVNVPARVGRIQEDACKAVLCGHGRTYNPRPVPGGHSHPPQSPRQDTEPLPDPHPLIAEVRELPVNPPSLIAEVRELSFNPLSLIA